MTDNDPDQRVESRIETLIEREHELRHHSGGRGLSDGEHEELRQLEIRLDQLWDLLRRRRATRESGGDPAAERLRDPDIVEHYRQ
jgi:hypothetical protein